MSGGEEVRIREFIVKSSDPVNDKLLVEDDIIRLIRRGTLLLPRLKDNWVSHGYYNSSSSENSGSALIEPSGIEAKVPLTCHGFSITKICSSGSESVFKYIAKYSTKINAWDAAVEFEVGTDTESLYLDLDAIESNPELTSLEDEGVDSDGSGCADWVSTTYDPATNTIKKGDKIPAPYKNWAHEAIIRNGEGVDIIQPQLTISIRQLVYAPDPAALMNDLLAIHSTTNRFYHPPYIIGENKWLCVSASGKLAAKNIFEIQLKAAYSKNKHRKAYYAVEQGSSFPKINQQTGLPTCRSYRCYRIGNWETVMNLFSFPK